jgi:GPI ethanolamine phosphate transferase 1
VLLIGVTMAVTLSSVSSLQAKRGLPIWNELEGWALLGETTCSPPSPRRELECPVLTVLVSVCAAAVPVLWGQQVAGTRARMLLYFLAFGPLFVLLSISVEGLFYVAFAVVLALWIEVEAVVRRGDGAGASGQRDGTETETEAETEASVVERRNGAVGAKVKVKVGASVSSAERYRPRLDDVRIALFFLFFVQVAFFGTGK